MKRSDALSKLRQLLLKRRDALRRSLDAELSFLGSNPEDPADDDAYSQTAEFESRELAEIDEALSRMREGQYGVCEGCGENISLARLQALPDATYCIRCQRDSEKYSATVFTGRRSHAVNLMNHVA